MAYNKYNTSIDELGLNSLPAEVQEQYWEFTTNVPMIKSHLAETLPRASDLPKDSLGRTIVDITKPHILEDMDYFRPSAISFQKTGRYTDLRPNPNPNSEYGKWFKEEIRRCLDGYVREADGEWIPGDLYFFWNYCPMQLSKKDSRGRTIRVFDFPRVWETHYNKAHYLEQARSNGKHATELASRSKGKSFYAAAMLAKRFILGENAENTKKVTSYIVAFDKAKLIGGDQTLNKFLYDIDHCAKYTQFPAKRLISTLQNMEWKMGYKNLDTGVEEGTLNSVVGKPLNDASKLRGSRGVLYLMEEAGSFPNLLEVYNNLRPSVEDGEDVFGTLYAYGTCGDDTSDFYAMQEIMYNPDGYNVYGIQNVYDKEGLGKKQFTLFSPAYLNYAGCYDDNGNSDVSKALIKILLDRYQVKYNSTDTGTITKRIAELPITPQEAILRTSRNMFPVSELSSRIGEIDSDPNFFNDVYVGKLEMSSDGTVSYTPTMDAPIRDFPTKNNKVSGAVEIYEMPQYVRGKIPKDRYIIGLDNYENDTSDTMSLGSMFVLDLWTDRLVAEYTGRPEFVDDLNEIARRMCLFYNAQLCYENNKKNTFTYFSRTNSLHLLADTPEYLRQRQLIKSVGYGNTAKGVNTSAVIKNFGFTLIRDWLLKPINTTSVVDGEEVEVTVPNLHFIRNRALLRELSLFNPDGNFDRIMALMQVMLFREEKMILYQGDVANNTAQESQELDNDPFFSSNYDQRYGKFNNLGDL